MRGGAIVGAVTGLLGGLLAVELLFRLLLSTELVFDTWYTPGVHAPSAHYGLVFAPGFHGVMYHPDGVSYVPLELDPHGFRRPARSHPSGTASEIVILGGASMMFAYGLSDTKAPHARLAHHATLPVRVWDVAWPGFDAVRSYHVYRDLLEHEVKPALVVVAIYNPDVRNVELVDDFEAPLPHPAARDLFGALPGVVLGKEPALATRLGSLYYATFLLPQLDRRIRAIYGVLSALSPQRQAGEITKAPEPPRGPKGEPALVAFVRHLEERLAPHGGRVLVAFLPVSGKPPDCYAGTRAEIADRVQLIDLQSELGPLTSRDLLANGHYGAELADRIGQRFAAACHRLLRGQPAPR